MKRGKLQTNQGLLTIELLIAFAILLITTTGVVLLTYGERSSGIALLINNEQSTAVDSKTTTDAISLVQKNIEAAKAAAKSNFDGLTSGTTTQNINGSPGYSINLKIEDISECVKKISSNVTWEGMRRDRDVGLDTHVTDVSILESIGGFCDFTVPNPWDNPGGLSSVDLSPSGVKATAIDISIVNGRKYAFLSTIHATEDTHDFWIIDVTEPSNPQIIDSINTGPGLNDVKVARINGRILAFVANSNRTNLALNPLIDPPIYNQLLVIDVTDPETVDENYLKFNLPGVSGNEPEGRSVYYFDDVVYVGTSREAIGSEFHIIDIDPNPNPVVLTARDEIPVNRNINEIIVRDGLAYLATGPGEANVNNPFRIYDIDQDSSSYLQLKSSFVSSLTHNQAGTSLYLRSNMIFLGLERAPVNKRDFFILNVNNPSSITVAGSIRNENACANQPNCGLRPNTQITGITVQGPYAFLSTNSSIAGFQVWNISDPLNIIQPSECSSYNYSEKATDIVYINDLIFISNESQEALRVIYDQPNICQ